MKEKVPQTISVALIGPLPPPLGGASVAFAALVRGVKKTSDVQFDVVDSVPRKGETRARRFFARLCQFSRVPRLIARNDVIFLNASNQTLIFVGSFFSLLCRIFQRKLILRAFGGSLHKAHKNSVFYRPLIGLAFRKNIILLETKEMISYFRQTIPKGDYVWFPNSRSYRGPTLSPDDFDDGPLRVVFLSQIRRDKGIMELVEAAKDIEDSAIQLSIYGPLCDGILKEDIEVSPSIRYLGSVAPDKVFQVLRKHHVFALPTYYPGEGYPGALIEAMFVGLPSVVTNFGVLREVVDETTSFFVDTRSVKSIESVLRKLLGDRVSLRNRSVASLNRSKMFDSEAWNHEKVSEVFESVKG